MQTQIENYCGKTQDFLQSPIIESLERVESLERENAVLRQKISELEERLLSQYEMMQITTSHLSEVIFKLELERETNLQKNEELRTANQILSKNLQLISRQRKQIAESIRYAARIQKVLMCNERMVRQILPQSFVLHLPKDILSGDFVYVKRKNHLIYLAVGDCTGHGIPAGILTVVAMMLLGRLIEDASAQINPTHIMHTLDYLFTEQMIIHKPNMRDGLELGLCIIDMKNNMLHYCGAHQSLYCIKNGQLTEYKGSKDTIGWSVRKYLEKNFETRSIPFKKGDNDCFYLATDGFADQFGTNGRKLMTKNFKKILESVYNKPVTEQGEVLNNIFTDWKGSINQTDDVLVTGFQL